MPIQTTSNVEKIAAKTPQAKDISGSVSEDAVVTLEVLDAALGGAAKDVYTLNQDPRQVGVVQTTAYSAMGALLTLNADGTISYDPTHASAVQALGAGVTAEDSFLYTIRLANGTLSTATIKMTVTGAAEAENHAPYLTSLPGDSAVAFLTEGDSELTASGTSTLIDLDAEDTVTVEVRTVKVFLTESVPTSETVINDPGLTDAELTALGLSRQTILDYFTVAPTGAPAGTTSYVHDGTQGTLTWNFDSNGEAFDFLTGNQILTIYYNSIRPDDGRTLVPVGDGGIVVRIQGTDEAPLAQPRLLGSFVGLNSAVDPNTPDSFGNFGLNQTLGVSRLEDSTGAFVAEDRAFLAYSSEVNDVASATLNFRVTDFSSLGLSTPGVALDVYAYADNGIYNDDWGSGQLAGSVTVTSAGVVSCDLDESVINSLLSSGDLIGLRVQSSDFTGSASDTAASQIAHFTDFDLLFA